MLFRSWFWDPVENASFMPWLLGTALIHSAIVVEKRDALKSWTVLLAIITFALSLVGTFLVRSGVLTSVHAFAIDPERGLFILVLLIAAIGGSLTLYAIRAPAMQGGGLFAPVSREGALVLNNLLLATATATVFLGTLYPLFLDAVGGDKISVGPPFFNKTFGPLMVPVLIAMAAGPMLGWKRGDLLGALQRLWIAFAAAGLIVLGALYLTAGGPILAVLGFGLAAWAGVGAAVEWAERIALFRTSLANSWRRARALPRATWGMTFAHLGMAISVAGIAASAFELEQIDILAPGATMRLGAYDVRLDGVTKQPGPNYTADDAAITVLRDGAVVATMHPQRRFFPLQRQTTSETAIRSSLFADLYLALGEADGKGGWTVRAYWKPLISWIWSGALVMALGAAISLSDRRWRVAAATSRAAQGAKA